MPATPPRVLRFRSDRVQAAAFGLVLADSGGVPTEALNLTAHTPSLGSRFESFRAEGFALARDLWGKFDAPSGRFGDPSLVELREPLGPEQILSPVEISREEREAGRRFVVSIGLNFRAHQEETGRARDLLMVKPVEPTGPFDALATPPRADLIDHEAELACVLLEEIDLSVVPPMAELERRLAYLTVNDLTDRAPIILDEVNGFTRGKSDAGFLPLGPWMVCGADLPVFGENLGLQISCRVSQQGGAWNTRQDDTTANLIRNPEQVFTLLAEQLAADPEMAGVDRDGQRHAFARREGERWVLPAGSLLLTGTPGGTCIRPPGTLQRLGLLIRGGFSMARARGTFVRDCVRRRAAIGYLQPGDRVETSVEHLGTQRWNVTPS